MYIDRVVLRNIRGFEELDFKLARPDQSYAGWTVFTGDNGSGKSTLLKAIAVGLVGRDTARALQSSFNRWVRHGVTNNRGTIKLDIVPVLGDDNLDISGSRTNKVFPIQLNLLNGSKETNLQADSTSRRANHNIWLPDATGWFSCGYGPFRRAFGSSPEANRLMSTPNTARYATMFQDSASLTEANNSLLRLHYRSLENRHAEREQLELILELLNDDLLPNQMQVAKVDSDGLWLIDRNGVELSWSDMGDGYRSTLALMIDIINHLTLAYGTDSLIARDNNGRLFINRSGIVLIDEIDAHLHPEWQREIGFWLKHRFPKIQFLVTTHSPIICQAADPNGLFVLPEPGSSQKPQALSREDYNRVIASRPDTILLTPAFGLQNTRSPEAVEERSIYARLKAKQRAGGELNEEEQKQLNESELFALNDEEL